ncbi:glycine zipper 2TM domain-containing protein [Aquariibacter albus]|uniref:Glycine zipper 2TM domain-containing protein n=1 Tax=Aquariibacter albus TaxID=2759899 RepID=A0A839HJK1_9BURK|nr:glycine zipper 2TM domain-containing protein [Aquariibacter albus]MBB1162897.1 glycine zipper 2TM domain-containing protein [Aquariibacter albus]
MSIPLPDAAQPRMHRSSFVTGLVGGGLIVAAALGLRAVIAADDPPLASPAPAVVAEAVPAEPAMVETVEPSPVTPPPAARKPAPVEKAAQARPAPVKVAQAEAPKPVAVHPAPEVAAPAVPADATPSAAPALCSDCARVIEVRSEQRKGDPSALGAIGGAVVGGLLGNQVGGGSGRSVATVGGAVAGGFAGRELEKHLKKKTVWVTEVRLPEGGRRSFEQASEPDWAVGDVLEIRDGRLVRR